MTSAQNSWLDDDLRFVVAVAQRAPSVLNTQPWRWRAVPDGLELLADSTRMLRVADPLGRLLIVSCGAALMNARLAVRHLGRHAVVRLNPDPTEPQLLAQVTMRSGRPVAADEERLFSAIGERRSNRQPFTDRRPSRDLVRRLTDAATMEGARFSVLDVYQTRAVRTIAAEAARDSRRDPARVEEIYHWVHARHGTDGLPADVLAPKGPGATAAGVRDFDPEDRLQLPHDTVFESAPQLAVLSTDGDARIDWMRAGQGLQRVLLEAALEGVSASLQSEPLELLAHRWRIRDATTNRGYPQMIIRLGYGPAVPASTRRGVSQILETPSAGVRHDPST